MKYIYSLVVVGVCLMMVILSCKKWQDPKTAADPRLTNPYCNDPAAVNYNWGFPGRPDDSVCFYPTDVYAGKYIYKDSVFLSDNTFTYTAPQPETLYMYALSKSKLGIVGFCANGDTLKLTVDKAMNASVDTTVGDTLTGTFGQAFCRIQDTISGGIVKDLTDTLNRTFHISFKVVSDTSINYHTATAYKQ